MALEIVPMYRTQRNVALFTYLAGVFGFTFYDAIVHANWSALDALGNGAQWPLLVLAML